MREKKHKLKNDRIESLVGKSMKVEGDVSFSGGLLIEGKVKGSVSAIGGEGTITLASSGSVVGDITAARIVINGPVTGDIHATEHIALNEGAVINGVVYYNLLEMSAGAAVNGNLEHKPTGKNRRGASTPQPAQGVSKAGLEDKK